MITIGSCNQLLAMDRKTTLTFTVNRVIQIEPHDYALDPQKPTIKNISFVGQNREKLHIYEAKQIKKNGELSIILCSPHGLNYAEWHTKRSPLFLDVYNQDTNEQMLFKYIPPSADSGSTETVPRIYTSIERSSDGTTTFIKTYSVGTDEEQNQPPKITRPDIHTDTPEDSDSPIPKEEEDDFLDRLADQQKKQREINSPKATSSFLAPLIISSAGFIGLMLMLYKSDRLPESFTQFFNTLFKNPLL